VILFEIISVNIDRMHLYCCSGNSCSSAHLPRNSSSSLLLHDYTVSAATFICGLAAPKMMPEPSVTVHVLGFCFCTLPAPRDTLRHILIFVLPALLPYPWLLLLACVTFSTICCAWLLSLNLPASLLSLFALRCGFYESAHVYMFSGYHRDVNEICARPGPTGWPEISIRNYRTTLRKNCRRAQIRLIFSHQSCLCVFRRLFAFTSEFGCWLGSLTGEWLTSHAKLLLFVFSGCSYCAGRYWFAYWLQDSVLVATM